MKYDIGFTAYDVDLNVEQYQSNGCIALQLVDSQDKEPVTVLSVNLEVPALDGYMYVNNDFFQENIQFMEENGLGQDTGRTEHQGFVDFHLMKLDLGNILDKCSNKERAKEIIEPMVEALVEFGELDENDSVFTKLREKQEKVSDKPEKNEKQQNKSEEIDR